MKPVGLVAMLCVYVVVICGLACADTIHVPADFSTIAAAVDHAVDGDIVMVAPGEYTGYGNRNIYLEGKAITVISEDGPETCIIDCQANEADNHRAFNFINNETDATVLSGFTIRNGYSGPHSPFGSHGGAVVCDQSSPVIENCIFEDNHAYFSGGAIEAYEGNTTIRNCLFRNNTVTFLAGAVYIHERGAIRGCTFIDNEALGRPGLRGHGGAVYASFDSIDISIADCLFQGNKAEAGGAIGTSSGNIRIYRSQFIENIAHKGGAITVGSNEVIVGGAESDGNTFVDNRAAVGAELFSNRASKSVNAQYNTFTGCAESEYWIYPLDIYNFNGCSFNLVPITQDVYVSPDGDDLNDGLSWESPFRTIHFAMSRILAAADNPVHIFLAPGIYSPSTNGEHFPFPAQSWTVVEGSGADQTILDAEYSDMGMLIYYKSLKIRGLTVTRGIGEVGGILIRHCSPLIENCHVTLCDGYESGGIHCYSHASPYIRNCQITDNSGTYSGGINCNIESSPAIVNCDISSNSSTMYAGGIRARHTSAPVVVGTRISSNYAGSYGGGIYLYKADPIFFNCLVSGNSAEFGGGLLADSSAPLLQNVTMTSNYASFGGAIHSMNPVAPTIVDSIIWGNDGDQIMGTSPTITYSDVQGGYPGDGNIDSDPLFVSGPNGYYYLSQSATGQPTESPCVDSGSANAADICVDLPDDQVCVSDTWTRRDQLPDAGMVDMGCHYPLGGIPSDCIHDGDVTQDGITTSGDAQLAFMMALGVYTPTIVEECAADCNGDDDVTAEDGQLIFLKAMGLTGCVDQESGYSQITVRS